MDLEGAVTALRDEIDRVKHLVVDELQHVKGCLVVTNLLLAGILGVLLWKLL